MRYRKFYPTVETLMRSAAVDTLAQIFNDCHYFDGTLTYPDSSGNAVPYPSLGFGPTDLFLYWSSEFERVQVGFGLYTCPFDISESDLISIASKVRIKAQNFIKLNKVKYLGLVKTYGLQYDPISNYDMVELKGSASKLANQITDSKLNGTLTTTTTPANIKTSNYTTTYDDASEERLAGYTTQEALNGSTTTQESTGNNYGTKVETGFKDGQTINTVEFGTEGDEMKSYLETPEGNQVSTAKTERKGNIGTTTTQEMIEAERELARQNILEEFFKDFNKHVLLGSWRV